MMDFADYSELLRGTPRPTDEQWSSFADYVAHAHSWYKHLDLKGGEFIVFLDPYAGDGFTVEHPRLHHTWKTTNEYRTKFGHLAYKWRLRGVGNYRTDYGLPHVIALRPDRQTGGTGPDDQAGSTHALKMPIHTKSKIPLLELPREVVERCSFVLYPYVWPKQFLSFCWDLHAPMLRQIRAGRAHPGKRVLRLLPDFPTFDFEYKTECKPVHDALWAWSDQRENDDRTFRDFIEDLERAGGLNARQLAYARYEHRELRICNCLERSERRKIARALKGLRSIVSFN